MRSSGYVAAIGLAMSSSVSGTLTWGSTKTLFLFGDSYTSTRWNISAGLDSPAPGSATAQGPNWVVSLIERYNVANTSVYNLAFGGATIDSKLVTPYKPSVQSIVDQVSSFKQYLSPPPAEVPWTSADSLFGVWVGINDIGGSFEWTNTTQPAFHKVLMDRLFGQIDILYEAGARSFVFLTVPPLDRTPIYLDQGATVVAKIKSSTADYNAQLSSRVKAFIKQYNATSVTKKNGPLGLVKLFDTQKVFNAILNNADALGFVNVTGWAVPYENGTATSTTQIAPLPPVSSYFWINNLHPLFTVHDILAKAISTFLS